MGKIKDHFTTHESIMGYGPLYYPKEAIPKVFYELFYKQEYEHFNETLEKINEYVRVHIGELSDREE